MRSRAGLIKMAAGSLATAARPVSDAAMAENIDPDERHDLTSRESGADRDAFVDYSLALILCLIGVAIPWHYELPLNFNVASPDFNPVILLAAIVLAIGLYVFLRALRKTARSRAFGITKLEAPQAFLGAPFKGRLLPARELPATGDYLVALTCFRVTVVSRGETRRTRPRRETLWRAEHTVDRKGVSALTGIPFSFTPPADAPPATGEVSAGEAGDIHWELAARAPTRTLDYMAAFAIDMRRKGDPAPRD